MKTPVSLKNDIEIKRDIKRDKGEHEGAQAAHPTVRMALLQHLIHREDGEDDGEGKDEDESANDDD